MQERDTRSQARHRTTFVGTARLVLEDRRKQ